MYKYLLAVLVIAATGFVSSAQADSDDLESNWTVATMDIDGSAWGVGTSIYANEAMRIAFANCHQMSKKTIGCGALLKGVRSGWILAKRCGREVILEADEKLKDAEDSGSRPRTRAPASLCAGYAGLSATIPGRPSRRRGPREFEDFGASADDEPSEKLNLRVSVRGSARAPLSTHQGESMKATHKVAFALVTGVAIGGAFIQGLQAQATPPTYVVIDISKITDPEGFKTLGPKAGPAVAAFGGKTIIRTENFTALDGAAPARFVVIADPSHINQTVEYRW